MLGGNTTLVGTSGYEYDDFGRLESLVHVGPSQNTIADYAGTFDTSNRVTTFTSDKPSAPIRRAESEVASE